MIIQKYLPPNTLRRPSLKLLGVKFGVAHDTGNLNSTAMQNVDYFIKSANETQASAHTFIDDVNIIECIPLDEKAYHVRRASEVDNSIYGVDAIDWALAVELCYFTDLERSKIAYKNYVEYWRTLCQKYELNPATAIIGHYTLDPIRRTDPLNAFKRIGVTWERFIKDLATPNIPNENLNRQEIKKQIIELLEKL